MKLLIRTEVRDFFNHYKFNPNKENGGILLGVSNDSVCKIFDFIQLEGDSDMYSIEINYHECKEKYLGKISGNDVLDIVGIWHTHLGECLELSQKDKENLKSISQLTDYPIISVLINTYGNRNIIFDCFLNDSLINLDEVIIF